MLNSNYWPKVAEHRTVHKWIYRWRRIPNTELEINYRGRAKFNLLEGAPTQLCRFTVPLRGKTQIANGAFFSVPPIQVCRFTVPLRANPILKTTLLFRVPQPRCVALPYPFGGIPSGKWQFGLEAPNSGVWLYRTPSGESHIENGILF